MLLIGWSVYELLDTFAIKEVLTEIFSKAATWHFSFLDQLMSTFQQPNDGQRFTKPQLVSCFHSQRQVLAQGNK